MPKKKGKKKKGEKGTDKSRDNGGAIVEEGDDSDLSRPQSRAAKVEEVEDEDAPGATHK
jgi:translocation protein SEC62